MIDAESVSQQLNRYVRYIKDGEYDDLRGWLMAVDLEWRRRRLTPAANADAVEGFLREWVRVKRMYA